LALTGVLLTDGRAVAHNNPRADAVRLVVLDFETRGSAPPELGRAFGEVSAAEATRIDTFQVVTRADVAAQLGLHRTQQALGCAEDESCMVELAAGLSADRILSGTATLLNNSWLLAVTVLDGHHVQTLARVGETLRDPTQAELADAVRRLAHEALTGEKLDTTGLVRIEVSEPGVVVTLDGQTLGVTPLIRAPRVLEGPHHITAQKPGFVPWEGTIDVAAGGVVPVQVSLVSLATLQTGVRPYAELFGGLLPFSQFAVAHLSGCNTTCIGYLGAVRVGLRFGAVFSVELFVIPQLQMIRTSTERITVNVGSTGTMATAPAYQESALITGTSSGLSAAVRFFDRTPLTLRAWLGYIAYTESVTAGGQFPNAPAGSTGRYDSAGGSVTSDSLVFGLEARIGYRLTRVVSADIGVGVLLMSLASMAPTPRLASQDITVELPPGPQFSGGLAFCFPLSLGLRFDL
jgi:hypothetical protein